MEVLCPVLDTQQYVNASVGYLALKYLNQSKGVSICHTGSMWTRGGESRDRNVITHMCLWPVQLQEVGCRQEQMLTPDSTCFSCFLYVFAGDL